jgi:hypothetical protein
MNWTDRLIQSLHNKASTEMGHVSKDHIFIVRVDDFLKNQRRRLKDLLSLSMVIDRMMNDGIGHVH